MRARRGIYRAKRNGKAYGHWIIQYGIHGQDVRENTHCKKLEDAALIRAERLGQAAKGIPAPNRKVTIADLLQNVLTDYRENNLDTLKDQSRRSRLYLTPRLGHFLAVELTTPTVLDYRSQRLDDGASPATVNRELAMLKHAYNLGVQQQRIQVKPHIPMLEENNVREGFFTPDQLCSLLRHLPEDLQGVVTLGVWTGWRKQELLGLEWRKVDLDAGLLRLDESDTKEQYGREFPYSQIPECAAVLERQRAKVDEFKRAGKITPWVFFWFATGERIKDFRWTWDKACTAAGCPGRLFHDLRRTAVRFWRHRGLAEKVIMQITGHRTRSIFERYNITTGEDVKNAIGEAMAARKVSK